VAHIVKLINFAASYEVIDPHSAMGTSSDNNVHLSVAICVATCLLHTTTATGYLLIE